MPRFSLEDIDRWINNAETPVALTSLASTGTTIAAPTPFTAGIATGSNIAGGLIDLYQGIRAGMQGDWANVSKNAAELALSLIGAKAISGLNKTAKVHKGFTLGKDPRMLGLHVAPNSVNTARKLVSGISTGIGSTSSMIELPSDNTRVIRPRLIIQPNNRRSTQRNINK